MLKSGIDTTQIPSITSVILAQRFLRELYDLPYSFESIAEVLVMAELGRFYRASPKISRSLTDAIHNSTDEFKNELNTPTVDMLCYLRNSDHFLRL